MCRVLCGELNVSSLTTKLHNAIDALYAGRNDLAALALREVVNCLQEFDESEHPRDETGKFASKEGSNGSNNTVKRDEIMAKWENYMRLMPIEYGMVIDDQGNKILNKQGERNEIRWTEEEAKQFTGNTFTHNHPTGGSFSASDMDALIRFEPKEIRAVGNIRGQDINYSASMIIDKQRTNMESALAEFHFETRSVNRDLVQGLNTKIDKGQITADEANDVYSHQLWTSVSNRLQEIHSPVQLIYKKEEL
jgi:hypothetical protein